MSKKHATTARGATSRKHYGLSYLGPDGGQKVEGYAPWGYFEKHYELTIFYYYQGRDKGDFINKNCYY